MVRVSNRTLFSFKGTAWQSFVDRVMSVAHVESVEVDCRRGTAVIRQNPVNGGPDQFLGRLSAALAAEGPRKFDTRFSPLYDSLAGRCRFRLFRRAKRLSTWEIVHASPGRLRVRDAALRKSPAAAQCIALELKGQDGIRSISISQFRGSVAVEYDPAVDGETILARLDQAALDGGMIACDSLPRPRQWLFANATLSLAVAGTFFYAPLLPASAVILVASNLSTFRQAWLQLRRREAGLPLLNTAIIGATLASGGFLASTLMNWLLVYWQDRRARLTERGRQLLASSAQRRRAHAWVMRDGVELETPAEKLQPGDIVAVRQSETIPADGRVLLGSAVLETSPVAGTNRLVCPAIGDEVHEGSCVVEGDIRIEVLRSGDRTMATAIGRALSSAASPPADGKSPRTPEFAERAVPPVMIMAGAGLMVGDAAVAAAVLRPDYATGPGIGDSFTKMDLLRSCFEEGILIRRQDAFAQIADADLFLFDHDRLLETPLVLLETVQVVAEWSADELLESAACGMRSLDDPRARAVIAANSLRGGAGRQVPVTCRSGGVEFRLRGRSFRIQGVGTAGPNRLSPLTIYCNGALAGSLTFSHQTACAAVQAIHDLRTQSGVSVVIVSSASASEANRFANVLGVDEVHLCTTDQSKAALIRQLRADNRRVVFVGDCRANPAAAAAANLAVFPSPDPSSEQDSSGIWLMQPEYEKLVQLREMAAEARRDARFDQGLILVPNVVCIAGAFLFGFTSLIAVVLSNLGTYSVYLRSRAVLRRAEGRLLRRRMQNPVAVRHDKPVGRSIRINVPAGL
jgi:Cu2+-exporting ATPase